MLKIDTTSFKLVICTDDGKIYYVDDMESMANMSQGLKYLLHNPAMIDLIFKSQ